MKKHTTVFAILLLLSSTFFLGSSLALPDLVVSWDDLDKSTAYVGEMVTATWKSKNRGTTKSSSCKTSVWLSKDRYWDETDIFLARGLTSSLDPGEYDEDSRSFPIPPVASGTYYVVYFADKAEDNTSVVEESGETNNENWDIITVNNPFTDIIAEHSNATEYSLLQNYPNPFNPSTKIRVDLPANMNVKLSVFNSFGEEVSELVNGSMSAGVNLIEFNASTLPSGIYFCRVEAGENVKICKMVLMK